MRISLVMHGTSPLCRPVYLGIQIWPIFKGWYFALPLDTWAGSVAGILSADCSNERGEWFRLDRKADPQAFQASFEGFPQLSNLFSDEPMEIEVFEDWPNAGDLSIGGGATDRGMELFGNASLAFPMSRDGSLVYGYGRRIERGACHVPAIF
ncbi:MAG: hypothetical protein HUU37_06600 [Bdellovibrionales bacterium]|nr:hypothetical protein [Bdellovibrionales bacterium]